MLRSLGELKNYTISAIDGKIGHCKDFLFDDELWTVRYMVADTGSWLLERKVLISPISLDTPDWTTHRFPVRLSKEQVEKSPPLDSHAPVSRQYETEHADFYNWPYYWEGGDIWGTMAYPYMLYPLVQTGEQKSQETPEKEQEPNEVRLRSVKEVTGYRIKAEDGEIGHLDDFIVEDDVWSIRYLTIDTRKWLQGKKVLVSPGWITAIDWVEMEVEINVRVEAVKNAPEYNPDEPINREYETRLYDYHGRPKYWE